MRQYTKEGWETIPFLRPLCITLLVQYWIYFIQCLQRDIRYTPGHRAVSLVSTGFWYMTVLVHENIFEKDEKVLAR